MLQLLRIFSTCRTTTRRSWCRSSPSHATRFRWRGPPSVGVSSIADYVAYAKEHPGLGFASSGVGSNQHVIGAWLAKQAGIKLDHVPHRGAGQAVRDLIA